MTKKVFRASGIRMRQIFLVRKKINFSRKKTKIKFFPLFSDFENLRQKSEIRYEKRIIPLISSKYQKWPFSWNFKIYYKKIFFIFFKKLKKIIFDFFFSKFATFWIKPIVFEVLRQNDFFFSWGRKCRNNWSFKKHVFAIFTCLWQGFQNFFWDENFPKQKKSKFFTHKRSRNFDCDFKVFLQQSQKIVLRNFFLS